jgi:predicted nuclease of predicted toxin-antitoxin system
MRFLLDENLSPKLCELLEAAGHDAISVVSAGLSGFEYYDIWKWSIQEGRLLITLDGDFADIRIYPPGDSPGTIWLRQRPEASISEGYERLLRFLAEARDEELAGRLVIIRHARIRVVPR